MAHQDQGRKSAQRFNAEDLHQAFTWLVTGLSFASIALRFDCTWTPQALAFAALLWSWSDEKTLTERFAISRKIIRFVLGEQHEPTRSYQAFIKLLRKWTDPLKHLLVAEFRVYYRHCKQTFERRKLRSHNPDNAKVELDWSLLGMWAMGVHSHHRLVAQGVRPERISFANVWRAYRRPMREYRSVPDPGERLTELLDRALIDPYERKNKASRDYPRKKQEPGARPPEIVKATPAQVRCASQIKAEQKKRLTA